LFDGSAGAGNDFHDEVRFSAVFVHVWSNENAVRAETSGSDTGHGRANAKLSRFVTGGGDNAALGRRTADDHGLAPKIGIVPLFYRSVERVHVDKTNNSKHGCGKKSRRARIPFDQKI
jgi:hypothetical protein